MPEVTVVLPGLLGRFTDGTRSVEVEGETVEAAVDALLGRYPALEPHLFTKTGRIRPHVRLLVNGRVHPGDDVPERSLEPGDEVAFVQAVSGG
jgi:molybdopterin converting factor small subunit